MRVFIVHVALALVCGALGKPAGIILGYQDTLGQYSFGYSAPDSARSEMRSVDGSTRGSYSYVDGAGLIQSTEYTADGTNGFRVAATNLPKAPSPVQDTPEVIAARAAHLLAVEQATRNADVHQGADMADKAARIVEPENVADEKTEADTKEMAPAEPTVPATDNDASSQGAEREANSGRKTVEDPQQQQQQKTRGRAVAESVQAPVIPSVVGSLSVPLIPIQVGLDLPTFSAYSVSPVGKVEGLPQATADQGAGASGTTITPAGTTLKTAEQPLPAAPRIFFQSVSDPRGTPVAAARSNDENQVERARAVLAPVNIIPLGYEPTIASFLRYAPFPYITYNVL